MKRLFDLFLRLLASIVLLAAQTAFAERMEIPAVDKPEKIAVFVAKKFVTMDPANPQATAVAVSNGKILSVGSLEELKPWLDRYPHEIDRRFEQHVVYPGFVDPHSHPLMGGITQTSLPLTYLPLPNAWGQPFPGVPDLKSAIKTLKEYSAAIADPNEMLLAWGYDTVAMRQTPDRRMLDEVSATRPILVWDYSEHNLFLNSAAIRKYVTDPDAARKVVGVGIEADGSLNGQFLGVNASQYLMGFAGKDFLTQQRLEKALMYSNDLAQQGGVTTTAELTFGLFDIEVEKALMKKFADSAATSLRIVNVAYADPFLAKYGDGAIEQVKSLRTMNNDRLYFKGIKFFSDDAYLSNLMKLEGPAYTDWHHGIIFYPTADALAKAIEPWWNAGFAVHVHSNGNAGILNAVNALQILQDARPRFDHRFTFEHLGLPNAMMVRKIKALGAIASVNPSYFYTRAGIQESALGSDRAAYATRVGNLAREGVVVALHSDNPVGQPLPLVEVWAVVNRQNLYTGDRKWAPAEAVSAERAMRMVTIDAAYVIGMEDLVGSIEPGKFADFTVLADDPVTVPTETIKDIPIIGTVLGGRFIPTSETRRERPL